MDKLLKSLNASQLRVDDHNASGQHVGSAPKGLTEAVILRLGGFDAGDPLGMDKIVSVDNLNDSVLHFNLSFLCLMVRQLLEQVGIRK